MSEKPMTPDNSCVLCSQQGGTLLWHGAHCRVVAVDDADYPGFCRVIWNQHVREMTDLSPTERGHLMDVVFAVEAALREELRPDKINLASLGNMIPHIHWHVIPRFIRDRHFPEPIWGVAQRTGAPVAPRGWESHLATKLRSKLAGRAI